MFITGVLVSSKSAFQCLKILLFLTLGNMFTIDLAYGNIFPKSEKFIHTNFKYHRILINFSLDIHVFERGMIMFTTRRKHAMKHRRTLLIIGIIMLMVGSAMSSLLPQRETIRQSIQEMDLSTESIDTVIETFDKLSKQVSVELESAQEDLGKPA